MRVIRDVFACVVDSPRTLLLPRTDRSAEDQIQILLRIGAFLELFWLSNLEVNVFVRFPL